MARRAGRYHAQLLIESPERGALHRFLDAWLPNRAAAERAARALGAGCRPDRVVLSGRAIRRTPSRMLSDDAVLDHPLNRSPAAKQLRGTRPSYAPCSP